MALKVLLLELGRRIIDSIHGVNVHGWTSNLPKGRTMRIWTSIFKHKEQFIKFTKFVIGDGRVIRVGVNSWSDPQPLGQKLPNIFTISLKKDVEILECW